MSHYALVDKGIVKQVIVAEQDYVDNVIFDEPGEFIQCSYNTYGGVHYKVLESGERVPSETQSKALRKNFPSPGFMYDSELDAFIPPKSSYPDSWVLDSNKGLYVAPVDIPSDGQKYIWNEDILNWEVLPEDDSWMDSYIG